MSKQSTVMMLANRMARAIVAEQTRARGMLHFDASILAAHEVFGLGPGRAGKYQDAYNRALETLAELYVGDLEDNGDKQLDYAKGKRDQLILAIVGPELFQPFDLAYGEAYFDELHRIRVMQGRE